MLSVLGAVIAFAAAMSSIRGKTWNEVPSRHWWSRLTAFGWLAMIAAFAGLLVSVSAARKQQSDDDFQKATVAAIQGASRAEIYKLDHILRMLDHRFNTLEPIARSNATPPNSTPTVVDEAMPIKH